MNEIKNINKCFYCTLAPKCSRGKFSHWGIHPISLPLHRLLSITQYNSTYYFMRQKNVKQKFHPYSYPCFIVFKKCAVGGGRKKLHAPKKII